MEDQELLRYSKQIMLPQVDVEGQQKIMDSTVLIIGMGDSDHRQPFIWQQQVWAIL